MEKKRKISCHRCQMRKIKCTRTFPCSNCTIAGHECNFRDDDSKRRPVGRNYVVALEAQLAQYKSLLRKAKAASAQERQALLDSLSLDDQLLSYQSSSNEDPVVDSDISSRMSTMSLQPSPQGSLLFHGPTSMYQKDVYLEKTHLDGGSSPQANLRDGQHSNVPQNLPIEETIITKALSLFFLYQYPQFMFIYRESFLEDYYQDTHQGKYWSYPLLYVICALGVRASPDAQIRDKGDTLAHYAETIVLSQTLGRPHITVAQTLLCLAYYELGAGNHSKGWVLAGMAFRMGQDLGLQQDPKFLVSQDATIASDQDLVIRRRVYYGLYVSDKIISLYLGRPVMLYEAEAAVDLPEPLPDFPQGHNWFGLKDLTESDLGHLGGTVLMPSFERLIALSKIIEDVLFRVFSTKMIKQPRKDLELHRSARLEELSVRLGRWHSNLPSHLNWNQWNLPQGTLKPHVLILHLLYHSILISLNRHFVRPTPGFIAKSLSKEICISSADSIIALIRQFRTQHGLGHSPVLVVYSAVMAGSGILFTMDIATLAAEEDRRLLFILRALEECSQTHDLAREARIKLQANIDARKALAAEKCISDSLAQPGLPLQSEPMDLPPVSWADGSMFDLGAFDLGAFGSLDSMAFEGIGADPSLGLQSFSSDPTLLENWTLAGSTMDFQSGEGYSNSMQEFDYQDLNRR